VNRFKEVVCVAVLACPNKPACHFTFRRHTHSVDRRSTASGPG
jgi:hypothetical protein